MNYVIDNCIEDNEKEGMCLDYGTFGTYVSGNTIRRNGDRNRQTDEDLEQISFWAQEDSRRIFHGKAPRNFH